MISVEWAHPLFAETGQSNALAKHLNQIHLAPKAPIVQKPVNANQPLLFQAARKINKGENRKAIIKQLQTSTARKPAAVVAAPAPSTPPPAPTPTPGAGAAPPASGNGGGGYSGNSAFRLGQASNPGYTTPAVPLPKP